MERMTTNNLYNLFPRPFGGFRGGGGGCIRKLCHPILSVISSQAKMSYLMSFFIAWRSFPIIDHPCHSSL